MARITSSWLSGPSAALPAEEVDGRALYRGEKYGLPKSGVGSMVSSYRRAGAMLADLLMAAGVAAIFTAPDYPRNWSLAVWFAVAVLAVWLFSFTPGQALFRIRVIRLGGDGRVNLWRAVVRAVLLFFVLPAVIWDRDGRGLHDKITGTALVRSR